MNFDVICGLLIALPGMALSGLSFDGFNNDVMSLVTNRQVTESSAEMPASRGDRSNETLKPKTTSQARSAQPAQLATPAGSPATGGGELASEQICPGQGDVATTARTLVCLTSQARKFHGLSVVNASSALMAAAVAKDQDMVSCGYSHTACGRAFDYWMTNKGFAGRCTAENIAQGQPTPRAVFEAWMKSPGHRANILNADYTDIGVAQLASSGGPLWAMELGGCK